MGEVIYHDFRKVPNSDLHISDGQNVPITMLYCNELVDTRITEAELYVIKLAEELDEQDFWDFVTAVNDPGLYDQLDDELKDLVDGFWACNAG